MSETRRSKKHRALGESLSRKADAIAYAPLQLKNPLNGSGGATLGARFQTNTRRQKERMVGRLLGNALFRRMGAGSCGSKPNTGWFVLLTRVSPKEFDDDNLAAAFKSVRDGIAESWLMDDASPDLVWEYEWENGEVAAVEAAVWVIP